MNNRNICRLVIVSPGAYFFYLTRNMKPNHDVCFSVFGRPIKNLNMDFLNPALPDKIQSFRVLQQPFDVFDGLEVDIEAGKHF